MIQRFRIGSTASRCLRRGIGQQGILGTGIHAHDFNFTDLFVPLSPSTTYPLHLQRTAFSSDNRIITMKSTKKRGIIARFQRMLRTIFGATDDTPRGLQERQDMYWIVLAAAHRKLRMANQIQHLRGTNEQSPTSSWHSRLIWQEESSEHIEQLMDEAVNFLDEKTDLSEMSILRLRGEMQTFLEPQIVQMMTVAQDVNEGMRKINDDEYTFEEDEEQEYKEIILNEYDHVCQLLQNSSGGRKDVTANRTRTTDPVSFYQIKKGAIETLLTLFNWWPGQTKFHVQTTDDEQDGIDNFGFAPKEADSDILPAMRYYHVRNLVRSSLVRRAVAKSNLDNEDSQQPHFTYSLITFKSTIPSAGRGVFVDGFAPAGTLLSFIPGKVWPKEHLQSASLHTQMQLSQNDPRHQLSMRYDDILIDSRQSPYTVVDNLFALGHIVNHPPAPTASAPPLKHAVTPDLQCEKDEDSIVRRQTRLGPNCVTVPISFTERMFEGDNDKLRSYLPNEYEIPPTNVSKGMFEKDNIIMHGMGLVALRDVKDEELFYDYRLSPGEGGKGQHPSWYHVWDEVAMHNRW
ncbi:hypothetical protein ACHAXH_003073, partial [Discostella pseudostelligera]